MKEENVTLKTVNNEIKYILCLLKNDRIHLENENERVFQIKDIFEYLPVKLGYFKIENIPGEVEDPERRVEQCPIISTDKGKAIYSEYERLRSK